MNRKFQNYTLEDFLEDPDFRAWVNKQRPDLDLLYSKLLTCFPEKEDVFYRASDLLKYLGDEDYKTSPEYKRAKWEDVLERYSVKRRTGNLNFILRYAAIFLAVFSVGSVIWYSVNRMGNDILATVVDPGQYSETTLILGEGSEYTIDGNQASLEYSADGGEVIANGTVILDTLNNLGKRLNQLIVPYGKQSKITLPDHTVVWVNAGSILLFPSKFAKNKRVVYLAGEAFFEVAKNKQKPFFLEMHRSLIEVLGTKFNVKSYSDEETDEAVLVEGSISLSFPRSLLSDDIVLKPEERIVVNSDKKFSVSHADVRNSMSWREGVLAFKEETLLSVFNQLSRFYGLEVECIDKDFSMDKRISGKLDLTKGYETVFNTLSLILGGGEYTRESGKIIFTPKNK